MLVGVVCPAKNASFGQTAFRLRLLDDVGLRPVAVMFLLLFAASFSYFCSAMVSGHAKSSHIVDKRKKLNWGVESEHDLLCN